MGDGWETATRPSLARCSATALASAPGWSGSQPMLCRELAYTRKEAPPGTAVHCHAGACGATSALQ